MTLDESTRLRQLADAELQRLGALYALETPARIAAILAKNTTPFDDYIATELLWQRFAGALVRADLRDAYDNLCDIDDFMLMDVSDNGRVAFKNITTRAYAYLEPDGTLTARGSYYHWPIH